MRLIDGEALEQELTEQIKSEEKDGNYFNVESLDRAREIDKSMDKYCADDPEMFAQDNGMKPADEYVAEFMDKLKNGEIKG